MEATSPNRVGKVTNVYLQVAEGQEQDGRVDLAYGGLSMHGAP